MHVPLALLDSEAVAIPDGFEMIDGELVEKPGGAKSSWVGGQAAVLLGGFCWTNRLGWVWPAGLGYRCFANARTVRKPNASFIRLGRLPNEELPAGDLRIPPDLAVEVVSPNDTVYELDEKVEEYLAASVRLVWVVNPESAHRRDPPRRWLDGQGARDSGVVRRGRPAGVSLPAVGLLAAAAGATGELNLS